MPERYASIDVGTNTVLLLVAERRGGVLAPVLERAEITRLGRGVDATGRLDAAAIRETVAVLAGFAREARALGAAQPACVATSAARDAANGEEFFAAARAAANLDPEVISGEEEARLVWASAWRNFGSGGGPLAVVDVGGGSTEFIFGDGPSPRGRTSLQVGAVRLTERHVRTDPPTQGELALLRSAAREALHPLVGLYARPAGARLVGATGDIGKMIGLDNRWAYNIVKQVGNYGESFARNLTPLGFDRGINRLWSQGGLMYAPPIR